MEDFNISRRTIQTIYKAVRFFGEGAWNENARLKADGERRILKRFPPTAQINWTDWKQRSDVFSNETVGGILGRGPRQRQLSEPGNEANNERGERGELRNVVAKYPFERFAQISRDPAEFWSWRLFAFELRSRQGCLRGRWSLAEVAGRAAISCRSRDDPAAAN